MEYFDRYVSNTYAASGNQLFFGVPCGGARTGRVLYKITVGGEYDYSLLFSNIIDSTYFDGVKSHKNLICDGWRILGARIGRAKRTSDGDMEMAGIRYAACDFKDIGFGGSRSKEVMPGEFFASDPIKLRFEKDEYLCFEATFSGDMIPYHEESVLPAFVDGPDGWKFCKYTPFPGMIGCSRKVRGRIAYLGDSITQGIGTPADSYLHWTALLSQMIGDEYAHWNIGMGFGRANDAASDGAWMFKALRNDIVFVCFGVNDVFRVCDEEQTKKDLEFIVRRLKDAGRTVVLQTVPPFDYGEDSVGRWRGINEYIKTELSKYADVVFDCVPVLRASADEPHRARYGGHPNAEGCAAWAKELYGAVRGFFGR